MMPNDQKKPNLQLVWPPEAEASTTMDHNKIAADGTETMPIDYDKYIDAKVEAVGARLDANITRVDAKVDRLSDRIEIILTRIEDVNKAAERAATEAHGARSAAQNIKWNILFTGLTVLGVLFAAYGIALGGMQLIASIASIRGG